jgi:hypothetical protein
MEEQVDANSNRHGNSGDGVALNLSRPKPMVMLARLGATAVAFYEIGHGIPSGSLSSFRPARRADLRNIP